MHVLSHFIVIFILWRKCGTASEITPCAVFDLLSKGARLGDVNSYVSSVKNKLNENVEPFVPVEEAVKPRPGLIEVCSVDAKDCPSADDCQISKNGTNEAVSNLPRIKSFLFLSFLLLRKRT